MEARCSQRVRVVVLCLVWGGGEQQREKHNKSRFCFVGLVWKVHRSDIIRLFERQPAST